MLLKIDYLTGNISAKKYYAFNDAIRVNNPVGGNITFKSSIYENYSFKIIDNTSLVLAGRKGIALDNNRFFALKLDTNLSMVGKKLYKYPASFSFRFSADPVILPSISTDGYI